MRTIRLSPPSHACPVNVLDLRGSYIDGPVVAAVLTLPEWTWTLYSKIVMGGNKGVWSDITRARRKGYRVEPYAHKRWLADVVAIDASKPVRCGGPMRPHYLKTVEERGGADPNAVVVSPKCPTHWRSTVGIFDAHRLCGYSSLIRSDDLLVVSQFICHGNLLRDGIAHALIAEILRIALTDEVLPTSGLTTVLYGGFNDGGVGLNSWKRRLAFEPARLTERA